MIKEFDFLKKKKKKKKRTKKRNPDFGEFRAFQRNPAREEKSSKKKEREREE